MGIDCIPFDLKDCSACAASCQESSLCVLTENGISKIGLSKTPRVYLPNQTIYFEGDKSSGVYCVESGLIAIRKTDADGNSALLRLILPGQTFGYRSFLAHEPHSVSAEVIMTARVCFVSSATMEAALLRQPRLALSLSQKLARDMREVEDLYLLTTTQPVRVRLAHLLLALKERFGTFDNKGELTISLPISRQELAYAVGTRPETIARTIRKFEDDGVAIFTGRKVTVPNARLLELEIGHPEDF